MDAAGLIELRQRIQDHLIGAFQAAEVLTKPFTHMSLAGAFPDEIYALLLQSLPDAAYYQPDNPARNRRADGLVTRSTLELMPSALAALPPESRGLWSAVGEALRAPELKEVVFDRLAPGLCRRFRSGRADLNRIPAYPVPTLVRDLGHYAIEPHPDSQAKIVTLMLYLPRDRDQLELGTALYRLGWGSLGQLLRLRSPLVRAKQAEFAPNSGLAFAVGHTSWHGRETIPMDAGVRNLILQFYYRRPDRR